MLFRLVIISIFLYKFDGQKKDNLEELVKGYGLVIVDECHHAAAFSFEKVLKQIKAKYVGFLHFPVSYLVYL